ncbi:lipocalin-like domain-containing protein [Candidatus Nitronereus thalassa]|uniref:Lipocalin-like domain-containing protein n=1 Tax=Candidatus Nitronereus thalassa TaxID=3020898 RepID=A0ABU3K7R6_9BACT|nr:lipocalin-like domain-containing protein [Candidatus Nitronereus thalassa]MDT7042462.1 lipocalin-like domain-containing protein [Candidatus Nitronereus thalassa]
MKGEKRRCWNQDTVVALVLGIVLFFGGLIPIFAVSDIGLPTSPSQVGVQAEPGYIYSFPSDHGSHDIYGLEWWYFTGHLFSDAGRRFGYELTFFRKALDLPHVQEKTSRWAMTQLYFAHFALTDVELKTFHIAEKLSRAGLGKAGADTGRLDVWIDQWAVRSASPDHQVFELRAAARGFGLDLQLNLEKAPVIHGQEGVSRKGADSGQASHYYSLTRLATKGQVTVGDKAMKVSGQSWMDHEFGSGELGDDQVGWDWFSLQFDSQMELMVYLLRKQDGTYDAASSGTLIFPDGRSQHLQLKDVGIEVQKYWISPNSQARYPSQWVLKVPSAQLSLQIHPVLDNQELRTTKSTNVTYWEGAVDVNGQHRGRSVQGRGYVELTGYAGQLKMDRN